MRYQLFGSLAGKTTSDRRLNIFKLLFGIIVGHWIGEKYFHRPRCLGIQKSNSQTGSGPSAEKLRNLDENFEKNGKIKVKELKTCTHGQRVYIAPACLRARGRGVVQDLRGVL